jgi:hypothetical protein
LEDADDELDCAICFHKLKKLDEAPRHFPVRLPCGHMFCTACVVTWLQEDPTTCPSCRADFNLSQDNMADRVAPRTAIVNAIHDDIFAPPPTPWWFAMLRPEVDPVNDEAF